MSKNLFPGKNIAVISGIVTSIKESEFKGYRVVSFSLIVNNTYYDKANEESKVFTINVPCKIWDKYGNIEIEDNSYVVIEGQLAIDKGTGLGVKVKTIEKLMENCIKKEENLSSNVELIAPHLPRMEDIIF